MQFFRCRAFGKWTTSKEFYRIIRRHFAQKPRSIFLPDSQKEEIFRTDFLERYTKSFSDTSETTNGRHDFLSKTMIFKSGVMNSDFVVLLIKTLFATSTCGKGCFFQKGFSHKDILAIFRKSSATRLLSP